MYIVALFHNKRRKVTFFFCIVGRGQLSFTAEGQKSSSRDRLAESGQGGKRLR